MTKEYNIIGFIDFMNHPSEDIVIILNYHIFKKKELNIKVDIPTSHIFEFITTTFNNNSTQQSSSIIQTDNNIIDYLIQTNINNIYLPSRHSIDIERIILNLYYNIIDLHLEHIIHHLENYITFNLPNYLIFNITFCISYISHLIIEPYSTIIETDVIRNVNTDKTSYMDIKITEPYITTGDTDISVYLIISIEEIINGIMETRTIIVVEDSVTIKIIKEEFEEVSTSCGFVIKTIVLPYVFILKGRQHHQGDRDETVEHIFVKTINSRIESDVLSTPFWTSHREGVLKTSILYLLY